MRRINCTSIRIHRCFRTLALYTSLNVAQQDASLSFAPFLELLTKVFPAKLSRTKGRRYHHVSSPAARVGIAAKPPRSSTSLDNVRSARRRSWRRRKKRRRRKLKMTESCRESDSKTRRFNRRKLSRVYRFSRNRSSVHPPRNWYQARWTANADRRDRETTQPGRDTGSQPTEDARTDEPDRRRLQRALDGAPWWGGTLSFQGPQGSAPAARCGVWPSVRRLNRKNDFCPRAHYCLPLLLLLCASCAAAFRSTECDDEDMVGRRFTFADETLNIQARDRIVWWENNEISAGNESGITASDFSTIMAAALVFSWAMHVLSYL